MELQLCSFFLLFLVRMEFRSIMKKIVFFLAFIGCNITKMNQVKTKLNSDTPLPLIHLKSNNLACFLDSLIFYWFKENRVISL